MELIKIVNTGKHPFTLRHDKFGNTHLPPGADRVVPIQVALVAFGDPKLKGRERESAYTMARQMFGFYEGIYPEAAWTEEVQDPNSAPGTMIGPFGPVFECFNLDNERMYFVLDNPTGEQEGAQRPGVFSADEQVVQLQAQLEVLTKQMAALTNQQTLVLGSQDIEMPTSEDNASASSEDDGKAKKVPAAKKAAEAPKPAVRPVGKDKPTTSRTGR